jgi:hypothetical protein
MVRAITRMKAACGCIVSLLDAAFHFRDAIRELLARINLFQHTLCDLLDRLGIQYELGISPIDPAAFEAEEAAHPSSPRSIDAATDDIGEVVGVDVRGLSTTAEKLEAVARAVRTAIASHEQLATVHDPPPISPRRRGLRGKRGPLH